MQTALRDFQDTVIEVEKYFDFLQRVNDVTMGVPALTYMQSNSGELFKIDEQLIKIFKANSFLLLYNLIEATVKNGIWELLIAVKSENAIYKSLKKELREIWLDRRIKLEFKTKDDTVVRQVYAVIEDILNDTLNFYDFKQQIKFESGNLNVNTIQETTKKYGLPNHIPISHNDQKIAFKNTKNERNHLAHGDKTFAACGKDYTILQLINYKDYIVEYLNRVLINIERSINDKEYLQTP